MTTLGSQDMAQDPRCRLIRINLAKEGSQVGLAQGLNVVDVQGRPAKMWADADQGDVFEELNDVMSRIGGRTNWLASMAQDVKKGRRSETAYMNGLVCRKGLEVGIPTPYNDAIVAAMHRIDNRELTQGPTLIDVVLAAVRT